MALLSIREPAQRCFTAVCLGSKGRKTPCAIPCSKGVNYYSNEAAAQSVVDAMIAAFGGKAISLWLDALVPRGHAQGTRIAVKADVKDNRQAEPMVQQVVEAFAPIDTLVLNFIDILKTSTVSFEVNNAAFGIKETKINQKVMGQVDHKCRRDLPR